MSSGIDVHQLELDRLCNLIYYWAVKDAEDPDDVELFKDKLWVPPKGAPIPKESPWSAESQKQAFSEFLADLNSMTK